METEPVVDPGSALRVARDQLSDFVDDLLALTAFDSGTWNHDGVDRAGGWCRSALDEMGFTTTTTPVGQHDGHRLGAAVVGRRVGTGTGRVLLLGHLDTVFADGTAEQRPTRVEGDVAYGPGVSDDKGGLLAGLYAVRVLDVLGWDDYAEIVVALTPDEEVGSPGSRGILQSLAREADVALCLECARENGDIVLARKGVADVRILVAGRSAHAGVEPERGASAAVAAARLVLELDRLGRLRPGTSLNVGVLRSGTRPNVVPDAAQIDVEVRATRLSDLDATLADVDALAAAATSEAVRVTTERYETCPPLEPTAESRALAETARSIAGEIGFDLASTSTGGVSDANLTASVGTPTLDGLGPVGGGDHSPQEWLDLASVAPRVALLAALIGATTAARRRPEDDRTPTTAPRPGGPSGLARLGNPDRQ